MFCLKPFISLLYDYQSSSDNRHCCIPFHYIFPLNSVQIFDTRQIIEVQIKKKQLNVRFGFGSTSKIWVCYVANNVHIRINLMYVIYLYTYVCIMQNSKELPVKSLIPGRWDCQYVSHFSFFPNASHGTIALSISSAFSDGNQ